jgi:RNA polymerase sigma factor (sigma-70 family)
MDQDNSDKAEWLRSAIERFESPLIHYATALIGDGEGARDVVQDTFMRLCRQRPEQLNGCLAEWLFTVCRHRAFDVRRKERRMTTLTEMDLETEAAPGPTPSVAAEQNESASEILRLVGTLPDNQQEVVRLKFQGGLSYAEISNVTSLSVSNVGFLLHNAIKTLRMKLRAAEGEKENRG